MIHESYHQEPATANHVQEEEKRERKANYRIERHFWRVVAFNIVDNAG